MRQSKKFKQQFLCKDCDIILESFGILEAHEQTHHEQLIKYRCDHCDISFKEMCQLDEHMETTHEPKMQEKQFNCNDCSFQGFTKKELYQHLRITHHEQAGHQSLKMISCHTCGLKFTDKPDLMKHRKLEHSDIIKKNAYISQRVNVISKRKFAGSVMITQKVENQQM